MAIERRRSRSSSPPKLKTRATSRRDALRVQSNFRRRETFMIVALQDFFVRLVVIRETIILRIPAQFLAWETRCFHGQQRRLGDAHADLERRPQMLFVAVTIIDPILPVIVASDFRKRLVFDNFSF